MNGLEPTGSHDLGDGASIVAISLVRHGAHRSLCMSRLDADRRPPSRHELAVQPCRQRTSLQSNPFEGHIEARKESMESFRVAGRPSLLDHSTGLINYANRG